ncbi:MAG TPA: HAD-IB family phosphatase [Patescibacteria group bacterium]|nr:HAD-IB family phosphatase [Patescibacteria group bacterium]
MTIDAGAAGVPPLVVLIDFDGTIARADVSDEVMYRFADRAAWAPLEAAYLRGDIGSRTLLTRQTALLSGDVAAISGIGETEELDPHFVPFVAAMREHGVPIEVVSDGFGFFVRPALGRLGLADLPVFTARTTFAGAAARIDFPDGHPTCRVCGTCKRERILSHQAAGSFVVFVGDGFSDLYAAGHADLVYAKDHLAELCAGQGWAYRPWTSFADIQAEVMELLEGGVPATRPRPFICGPEAWPAGTTKPIWATPPAARSSVPDR